MKRFLIGLLASLLLTGCGQEKPVETFAHEFVETIEVEAIEVETIHVETMTVK